MVRLTRFSQHAGEEERVRRCLRRGLNARADLIAQRIEQTRGIRPAFENGPHENNRRGFPVGSGHPDHKRLP